MERKIGEIFEYNGEWYQCIVGNDCENCAFNERKCYTVVDNGDTIGDCCADRRKDNKDVIFKKLEKVGEPYKVYGRLVQKYSYFCSPAIQIKGMVIDSTINTNNNDLVGLYTSAKITYKEFDEKLKTLYADKEECKSSLKEFDLEAAKAGKPVCTRDGRKARIICFDRDWDMHIVALVTDPLGESVHYYLSNGKVDFDKQNDEDLMMLPEKKEGWVNIDKGGSGKIAISSPYSTKEEAIHNDNETTIDTIKISWKE